MRCVGLINKLLKTSNASQLMRWLTQKRSLSEADEERTRRRLLNKG